jgi:hypothetical protein
MSVIPVPLYHGTSTLFLEGVLQHGLGGKDALAEWGVLEFARVLAPLVREHCEPREDLVMKATRFLWMTEQKCEVANFQHGQAYLSPSIDTAIRYAAGNRYGSELLTNTLDLLRALLNLGVRGLRDDLYRQFPEMFEKLDVSPAPLLMKVENVPTSAVLSEQGRSPDENLRLIEEHRNEPLFAAVLQQVNFRLLQPQKVTEVSLINVSKWNPSLPEYTLYALRTPSAAS